MRWLSYFVIVTGAYLVVATGYDQYQARTSIQPPAGHASITMPIQISKKDDPLGFRNAIVVRYLAGLLLIGGGWRLARSGVD
jgi:hypothetical protein